MFSLGTPFTPTKDRDAKGQGFTHHRGDVATITSAELGSLADSMSLCCEPWTFDASRLMRNLAGRSLLQ